jgi:predicted ATPase/DNA-binding SARP family transcriptional activator
VDVSDGPVLRVEVLGPLRVLVGGASVEVPGPKRRAVLALLALAEGRTVPVDDLVDALWPSDVPESGRQALHTHVSRLRGHLGPAAARLQTRTDGYRLDLAPDGLDLAQARALFAAARTDTQGGLPLLREAHALWRGPVLADLTDVAPIAVAVEGCARLHREVTDTLIAAAVDAGRAGDVVGLATAAHAADPLHEPAALLLMRVLAATGRAPDALRIGREYRRRLAEETGLDPSPALGEVERDVAGAGTAAPVEPTRPATRLFGRDEQVAALHRLLATERLVTVIGPGGVGKTRLALEVARRSEATTVLLLAPVTDPAAIPHALAAGLNLQVVQGDVLAACAALLGDGPGLLVVDNCEHLLDAACDVIGTLLSACPRLSVLATSREPLGLSVEHAFRLAPLALPRPGQEPSQAAAVAVFLDRARRVRPGAAPTPADLELVADVVRHLDGMPLAIELAAGRLSTFSLADLHRRLDRALDLLGGRPSGEARHRTLRATVEWSYRLLGDDERRLFRYLAVFVDGIALDAAEELATSLRLAGDPGTVLSRLVDASMLDAEFTERGTRYRMLETLRAFGLDRLAAEDEDGDAGDRLLRWAVALAEWFEATVATEREPEADAVLRRELANLRAAWRLARDRKAVDDAAALVGALHDAVDYRDLIEIRGWVEELAADFADDPALARHPRAATVLGTAGEAAYHRGDHTTAERLARLGLSRATDAFGTWRCRSVLAVVALAGGAYAECVGLSLASVENGVRVDEVLGLAALATAYDGDLDRARELHARGRAGVASPSMRAWSDYVAGEIESLAGDADAAERHYLSAIDLARNTGATFLTGIASVGLVALRGNTERIADALRGYREVVDYFGRTGNWPHLWPALRNLAALLRRIGDPDPATVLDAAADHAPEAPPVNGRAVPPPATQTAGRAEVLAVARQAVERNLSRPEYRPASRSR